MNRLCIFAQYDKNKVIGNYVVEYFYKLYVMYIKMVFVSVSEIIDTSSINNYVVDIMLRNNPYSIEYVKNYSSVIEMNSEYDVSLIINHLNRVNGNV